jgi:hypothetical protein
VIERDVAEVALFPAIREDLSVDLRSEKRTVKPSNLREDLTCMIVGLK